MERIDILLKEKLLQMANPKYWGEKFYIQLRGGASKVGILKRVNWTMRFGKVVGYCIIGENGNDVKIELEDLSDISSNIPTEEKIFIPHKSESPEREIIIPEPKREIIKESEGVLA
jgi:hypothetical protein